jgi:hypothetical protein
MLNAYHLICFSDIVSVEPRNGSQAGGTVLKIKGKAFSFVEKNVEVTVGGEVFFTLPIFFPIPSHSSLELIQFTRVNNVKIEVFFRASLGGTWV